MQKRLALLTVVVILTLLSTTAALGQSGDLAGTGWYTIENVQNASGTTATITVDAYTKGAGTAYSAPSAQVAPGAIQNYTPNSFTGMPSGFQGSGVVSSDQPIKAVTLVENIPNGAWGVAGGKAAGIYQGTETPDTTLYFPAAKYNRYGKTTAFYIQNAGGSAATASVTFRMDDGQTYPYTTPTIQPNLMVVVLPSQAGVPQTNANRANIGSMKVTSSQPLAGVMLEFDQTQSVATVLGASQAYTAANFDNKAYLGITKHSRFGHYTQIQVQNVSSVPIKVTIDYVGNPDAAGCANGNYTDTSDMNGGDIPAGASRTWNQLDPIGGVVQTNLPGNCAAAATVHTETANGKFVALVTEMNLTGSAYIVATYAATSNVGATKKILVPQFKDKRYGISSRFYIMNVGTAVATNVVATFECKSTAAGSSTFQAVSQPITINTGAAYKFLWPSTNPTNGFVSGKPFAAPGTVCGVTVTGDQPLLALINDMSDVASAVDDTTYEGFNVTP